jgi:hypothetical protein
MAIFHMKAHGEAIVYAMLVDLLPWNTFDVQVSTQQGDAAIVLDFWMAGKAGSPCFTKATGHSLPDS